MNANLVKTLSGMLPADPDSDKWYRKRKLGAVIRVKATEIRNYGFLKKFFALLNLGFEYWQPGEISCNYGVPEKNFNQFREDITILAGYFYVVHRLDGSSRVKAKSISFDKMEEDEFTSLYSNVLDALIKRIPMLKKMGADEVNKAVNKLLEFA